MAFYMIIDIEVTEPVRYAEYVEFYGVLRSEWETLQK